MLEFGYLDVQEDIDFTEAKLVLEKFQPIAHSGSAGQSFDDSA